MKEKSEQNMSKKNYLLKLDDADECFMILYTYLMLEVQQNKQDKQTDVLAHLVPCTYKHLINGSHLNNNAIRACL